MKPFLFAASMSSVPECKWRTADSESCGGAGCRPSTTRLDMAASANERHLQQLADRYPILQNLRRTGRDLHDAGLVGKFAVKIRGAGKPAPRFDAQKRRAAGLRPDSELAKSFPGNFQRWTVVGRVADRAARGPIEDNRVVIEQPLRQRQRFALDRRRLRLGAQQAVLQPPDRRRLLVGESAACNFPWPFPAATAN